MPEVGRPSFSIGDDEMEIGMGIHGEPGIRRGKLQSADAVVDEMMKPLLSELALAPGDQVAVLMNGLGGTPWSGPQDLHRWATAGKPLTAVVPEFDEYLPPALAREAFRAVTGHALVVPKNGVAVLEVVHEGA